jgi:hypothetical protein
MKTVYANILFDLTWLVSFGKNLTLICQYWLFPGTDSSESIIKLIASCIIEIRLILYKKKLIAFVSCRPSFFAKIKSNQNNDKQGFIKT